MLSPAIGEGRGRGKEMGGEREREGDWRGEDKMGEGDGKRGRMEAKELDRRDGL